MLANKEPSYFAYPEYERGSDLPWPSPYVRTWDEYLQLFVDTPATAAAIGEASTLYLQAPGAARRIADRLPNTKLIVILRHPVERAYSHFLLHRQSESEPIETFADAMAAEGWRRACGWRMNWFYAECGLYADQLREYYNYFSKDQVLVLLFQEDLVEFPEQTMQKVCNFLEIDSTCPLSLAKVHNITCNLRFRLPLSLSKFLRTTIANRYGEMNKFQKSLVGFLVAAPAKLPPDLMAHYIDQYNDSIIDLQRLIDRDLTHWLQKPSVPHAAHLTKYQNTQSASNR